MTNTDDKYQLLDCGDGRKLERFGKYVLDRPCAQAVWRKSIPHSAWAAADAFFTREHNEGWRETRPLPREWKCTLGDVTMLLSKTDFGHVGVFPEHVFAWNWMKSHLTAPHANVLNLFAYSGGASIAMAKAGCNVCHLDASKKMVDWAHRNAQANSLEDAPIRWIVDDVGKFLQRELRRGKCYDGIVLDPPSFGRGTNQEVFKIDNCLMELLENCGKLLSDNPMFIFLSCHTPGYTPTVLKNLLLQTLPKGGIEAGELLIPGPAPLPSGMYAGWFPNNNKQSK
ncbi:MAG: class I SAM-dependent methyltransferase [Victivallales bacterium]|nr:class I SAM-dependent methyltransferase [Victivallales bacterium]